MNEQVIEYLELPRYELVSLFGPDWQDPKRAVDDKLSPQERIALIPYIKPRITQVKSIQDQVIADMENRKTLGVSKYGHLLYTHNGRDMLQDAYEEILDLACYLKCRIEEQKIDDRPTRVTSES